MVRARLRPHLQRTIFNSPFIPTDAKDGLFKSYEDVYQAIVDMVRRERGIIAPTPKQRETVLKIWKKMQ